MHYCTSKSKEMSAQPLLPLLFLSHGAGPANFLDCRGSRLQDCDRNSPSASFLRGLAKIVDVHCPCAIRCLLVISAHWEEPTFVVDYQEGESTRLIYDYGGFPAESYAPYLTYPVKTDLEIANKVVALLRAAGLPVTKKNRGFDHGVFIPLKLAYPDANIPIVQLSLKDNLSLSDHTQLGEVLQPLRKEGVLIVGSGQITHSSEPALPVPVDPRAVEFTNWMHAFLSDVSSANYREKKQVLAKIAEHAPHYCWAHGRPEHFIPMAVVFGAAFGGGDPSSSSTRAERIYHEVVLSKMAVDCYIFSSAGAN